MDFILPPNGYDFVSGTRLMLVLAGSNAAYTDNSENAAQNGQPKPENRAAAGKTLGIEQEETEETEAFFSVTSCLNSKSFGENRRN